MNVRMGLIRKKSEWTAKQFLDYWRGIHGPLAARAPNLREYWQNAVTDRLQRGWFDDVQQADSAFKGGAFAAKLIADERHFLGDLHIVTAAQHVVIPVPAGPERGALLKRISTLKRRPEMTEDDFRRGWIAHRDLVRKMPGVSGYRQNVVIARERIKGQPCSYDDFPIDGIVELWFETPGALDAAFSSPAGQATMAHAKTFLAEITAFVVIEQRVI